MKQCKQSLIDTLNVCIRSHTSITTDSLRMPFKKSQWIHLMVVFSIRATMYSFAVIKPRKWKRILMRSKSQSSKHLIKTVKYEAKIHMFMSFETMEFYFRLSFRLKVLVTHEMWCFMWFLHPMIQFSYELCTFVWQ